MSRAPRGVADCPVCNRPDQQTNLLGKLDAQSEGRRVAEESWTCRTCGEFSFAGEMRDALLRVPDAKRYILSGSIRKMNREGERPVRLTADLLPTIYREDRLPAATVDRLQGIGYRLVELRRGPSASIHIDPDDDYPTGFATDWREFLGLLTQLWERGLITKSPTRSNGKPVEIRMTPDGTDWLDALGSPPKTDERIGF